MAALRWCPHYVDSRAKQARPIKPQINIVIKFSPQAYGTEVYYPTVKIEKTGKQSNFLGLQ